LSSTIFAATHVGGRHRLRKMSKKGEKESNSTGKGKPNTESGKGFKNWNLHCVSPDSKFHLVHWKETAGNQMMEKGGSKFFRTPGFLSCD